MVQTDSIKKRIEKQKADAEARKKAQEEASGGTPVTPLGVSGLGANPDQAKMAGVPTPGLTPQTGLGPGGLPKQTTTQIAATQADAEKDVSQDAQLRTELGEKSYDDQQMDAAQKRAADFSGKMQSFGSLGGRVEALVSGAFSGEDKNLAQTVGFEIGDVSGLVADGVEPQAMTDLLTQFNTTAQTDPQAAFNLLAEKSELFENPSSGIMSIVKSTYKTDDSQLQSTVAKLISDDIIDPNEVNLESLLDSKIIELENPVMDADGNVISGDIVGLGIGVEDLQAILGDKWKTMTPEQIGEAVEETRQDLLTVQEDIQQRLSDPNLPPQTRTALMEELRRMGATGAIQYEEEAELAQEQASTSGMIMKDGKVQNVADLLQDENIKTEVKNYLSDPEGQAEWKERNPEFAEWIDREMGTLIESKGNLESAIDSFADIQKSNEDFVDNNVRDIADGKSLKTSLMNAFGFTKDGFQAETYEPGDNPLYDMVVNLPEGAVAGSAVDLLNSIPEDQFERLKILQPNEIKAIITNPAKAAEFKYIANLSDRWAKTRDSNNVDVMLDTLFGNGHGDRNVSNAVNAKERLADLFIRANVLGEGGLAAEQYDLFSQILDQDRDGVMDSLDLIKQKFDSIVAKESDITNLSGSGMGGMLSKLREVSELPATDDKFARALSRVTGDVRNGSADTEVSNSDLDLLAGELDIQSLASLKDDPRFNALGLDKNHLDRLIDNKAVEDVKNKLNEMDGSDAYKAVVTGDISFADIRRDPTHVKNVVALRENLQKLQSEATLPIQKEAIQKDLDTLTRKSVEPAKFNGNESQYVQRVMHNDLTFSDIPKNMNSNLFYKKSANGPYFLRTPEEYAQHMTSKVPGLEGGPNASNQNQYLDNLRVHNRTAGDFLGKLAARWDTWASFNPNGRANGSVFARDLLKA